MGADFSDIENTLILDKVVNISPINTQKPSSLSHRDEDSISNLFQSSEEEQNKVIHDDNVESYSDNDSVILSNYKIYFTTVQMQIMMSLIGIRELDENQKITSAIFLDCFKVIVLNSAFEKGILSEEEILSKTMKLSNLNQKITFQHFQKASYLIHEVNDQKAIDIVNKTAAFYADVRIKNIIKTPFLKNLIDDPEYYWNFD